MSKDFNPLFLKMTIIDMDDLLRNQHLVTMCRALSEGGNSGMNLCLNNYSKLLIHRSVNACGILAHYLDIPIGWALFTYEDDYVEFSSSDGEAASHVYVHPNWRRLSVGTRLVQMASRMASPDTLRIYQHNAFGFFNPLIQQIDNLDTV